MARNEQSCKEGQKITQEAAKENGRNNVSKATGKGAQVEEVVSLVIGKTGTQSMVQFFCVYRRQILGRSWQQ